MWDLGDKMYLKPIMNLKPRITFHSCYSLDISDHLLAQRHFWKTTFRNVSFPPLTIKDMHTHADLLTLEKYPKSSSSKIPGVEIALLLSP